MLKTKFQRMVRVGLFLCAPLALTPTLILAQDASGSRVEQLSEMQGDTALINAQAALRYKRHVMNYVDLS